MKKPIEYWLLVFGRLLLVVTAIFVVLAMTNQLDIGRREGQTLMSWAIVIFVFIVTPLATALTCLGLSELISMNRERQ